jgi:hypothetical protein
MVVWRAVDLNKRGMIDALTFNVVVYAPVMLAPAPFGWFVASAVRHVASDVWNFVKRR